MIVALIISIIVVILVLVFAFVIMRHKKRSVSHTNQEIHDEDEQNSSTSVKTEDIEYPSFSEQIHTPATFDKSILDLDDDEERSISLQPSSSHSSLPSQTLTFSNTGTIF